MRCGQASSEHPIPSHAVGEVVGSMLELVDDPPDLAILFVGGEHVAAIDDLAFATRELLRPEAFIGCSTAAVIGGGSHVPRSGVSLFAMSGAPATALRLRTERHEGIAELRGWPPGLSDPDSTLPSAGAVVMADPFSFRTGAFATHVADTSPDLALAGGLASGGDRPGTNRLIIDGTVVDSGAVAALIGAEAKPRSLLCQSGRPVGAPFTVTDSDGGVIRALGGRRPLDVLDDALEAIEPELRPVPERVMVGIAMADPTDDHQPSDFLVRNLASRDEHTGAIATDHPVPVGTTVQFVVPDALVADIELRHQLIPHQPTGALLFAGLGRATQLFEHDHHDPSEVSELLGRPSMAGMFTVGEIGPVAGRPYLHAFCASVLTLG